MNLWLDTPKQLVGSILCVTALAVVIPVAVVAIVFGLNQDYDLSSNARGAYLIAAMVPLLIVPPLAFMILKTLQSQTAMIRAIDARIMFDMLTGTLNRNHFLDSVRAGKSNGPIMIVDADHFKAINDRNGHAIGDEALRILANAIQKTVGDAGIVGRLGGEEFGVYLPAKSEAEGHVMAEAICDGVRALSPLVSGSRVDLAVSIGCAYHRATKVIGHSLKEADDLLYRAKAEGRDRAVYIPSVEQRWTA